MSEFDLISYYNEKHLTGLTDEQIAKALGITVDALIAALVEKGYYSKPKLPKKFTVLTYKNGTADYDPWFCRYIEDGFLSNGGPKVWFEKRPSSNSDEHDKRAYLAFLDKLFYTTFTFTDKQTLKDVQVNPFAGDCNFGMYLKISDVGLTFNVVCASNPNYLDQDPLMTFSISLQTDTETGLTMLIIDGPIEVNQEAINYAHIQSIEVSMMSLYYD